MPTRSLRERAEDSLSRIYIKGYRKGQKDFAKRVKSELSHLTYYQGEVNPKSVLDDVLQIIDSMSKSESEG